MNHSDVKYLALPQTTPSKINFDLSLSDAMLLGIAETEKTIGVFSDYEGRTCALGAALKGAGALLTDSEIIRRNLPGNPNVQRLRMIWNRVPDAVLEKVAKMNNRGVSREALVSLLKENYQ